MPYLLLVLPGDILGILQLLYAKRTCMDCLSSCLDWLFLSSGVRKEGFFPTLQSLQKLYPNTLAFFKPIYRSLIQPHLLWTTCYGNSYELNKASIQAKYLSGRFRTEKLLSKFSNSNSEFCQLHPQTKTVGDLYHHLIFCPALQDRRQALFEYWKKLSSENETAYKILTEATYLPHDIFLQFILDCSVLPHVILAADTHGISLYNLLFKATRTYCYSMYRTRKNLLGQWLN